MYPTGHVYVRINRPCTKSEESYIVNIKKGTGGIPPRVVQYTGGGGEDFINYFSGGTVPGKAA